jgi:hypothetical protein
MTEGFWGRLLGLGDAQSAPAASPDRSAALAAISPPDPEGAGGYADIAGPAAASGLNALDRLQHGAALGTTGGGQEGVDAWRQFKAGDYAGAARSFADGLVGAGGLVGGIRTKGGIAAPVRTAAGEQVLGAGPIRFDRSALSEVPNVPQFDLPRNIPPRGVPARVVDVTNDPGVRQKMLETIDAGREMGGANWYNTEPLRLEFTRELGEDAGNQAFRKYMDYVAATSPRSDVGTNVRNASYYYQRDVGGLGVPVVGDKNPQPYGHMAQRLHQMNAQRVESQGWDPLNNPKPASFVENLVGNQQPVTVDTHAFRLPAIVAEDPRFLETAYQTAKDAPKQNIQAAVKSGEIAMPDAATKPAYWQAMPKDNEYAAMERYYQGLGKELGLTPAQTQASAWVGGGNLTGLASDETKPFLGFFEDRVNKTAQARGMEPREVLQRFIRGQMPLLGIGAAAGAPAAVEAARALANQDQQ